MYKSSNPLINIVIGFFVLIGTFSFMFSEFMLSTLFLAVGALVSQLEPVNPDSV